MTRSGNSGGPTKSTSKSDKSKHPTRFKNFFKRSKNSTCESVGDYDGAIFPPKFTAWFRESEGTGTLGFKASLTFTNGSIQCHFAIYDGDKRLFEQTPVTTTRAYNDALEALIRDWNSSNTEKIPFRKESKSHCPDVLANCGRGLKWMQDMSKISPPQALADGT